MSERLFLTGATGYIGSHLLRKWLDATDAKVAVLARPRHEVGPAARIRRVLDELDDGGGNVDAWARRIEVVEGDIVEKRFGLDETAWARLAKGTSHIIHCAAAARFDLTLEAARRINVGGTRNVLALARASRHLERMDYIGTAYVAGRRTGVIREDELDVGQAHNNTYEQTKLEAEQVVRDSQAELPIAILRPSIVICDSQTGRVSSHNGFSRALTMYASDLMRMLPGRSSSRMDLVPVDFVVEAVFALGRLPAAAGRCYHLTAGVDGGTTIGEIRALASKHFEKRPFDVLPPVLFDGLLAIKRLLLPKRQRKIIEEVRLYVPYVLGELAFDNTNLRTDTGLVAPPVRDYFSKMASYIRETAASA